ncbi:MAG: acetyltransferase [Ignavibacteria bacterium]|nr:acetyltransferase [Ignavibacteria bacterium]
MIKEVIIIGAGGHGAEINDYINYNNSVSNEDKIQITGFLDDNPESYSRYKYSAPLLGGIKDHKICKNCSYILGIANLTYRKKFADQFINDGAKFISVIHKSAYISPSALLGSGIVIGPMANIGPNVNIGDFTLINSRCSLGHDTIVGKYNFICPNVSFSGFTTVGDENLFGINSATIPNVKIGCRNKIMAGMIISNDVGDDETVFYRFKEKVFAKPKE